MILKKDLKTATPDSIPPQMEFAETLLVAHGYSVIKIKKDSWYIVKNEHGTYGEFYDYILEVSVDLSTQRVSSCNVNRVSQHLFPADKEEQLEAFVADAAKMSINDFCKRIVML
jgi:hypothetical protein